jgi:tripartite ATP-independent transporter DctP family solute receptor
MLLNVARAAGLMALSLLLAPTPAEAQQAKYVAKLGHLEAPTQPRHLGLVKVAALVKERTKGEVEFQLYPASQLGNARQMNEGVQLGTLEATVMPGGFLGGFNPVVSVLDIPFLMPADRALAQKLREGAMGKAVLDSFASRGFVAIGIWPNGRKNITSNKPLDNADAMKGQRFRVMDSKILVEQFNGVGASAIPINFGELYTALQTGVVDGQENPLDTIYTMKFHEVQKNLLITDHGVLDDIILFNPGWWNRLPAGHREVIVKTFDEARPEVEKTKEAAQKTALDGIKTGTIQVRETSEADRQKLRALMYPKARAAFLERAGAEGQKVIQIYEDELKRLGIPN